MAAGLVANGMFTENTFATKFWNACLDFFCTLVYISGCACKY